MTPEQLRRYVYLRDRIIRDPLTHHNVAQARIQMGQMGLHLSERPPLTSERPPLTVKDALAERLMFALLTLEPKVCSFAFTSTRDDMDVRLDIVEMMLRSQPFYWKQDLIQEAVETQHIPAHTISHNLLPHQAMYVTADRVLFSDLLHPGRNVEAMLWSETKAGLEVIEWIAAPKEGLLILNAMHVNHGAHFPEEVPEVFRENARQILAMIAFLNSPYIDQARNRLSRSDRRERVRLAAPLPEPELTVVQLRAREPAGRSKEHEETGLHPGDDGHWWVRGHVRAQWYASEQAHRLIWIAPHIRGNPEAPYKGHTYAVVR